MCRFGTEVKMINYIKMNLFKLFRSRAFWICTIIIVIFNQASCWDARDIEKMGIEKYCEKNSIEFDDAGKIYDEGTTILIGSDSYYMLENGISIEGYMVGAYKAGVMPSIILLIIAILICGEFSTGYIKNTIMIPKKRWISVISWLVISAVVFFIENAICIFIYLVNYFLLMDGNGIGNLISFAKYMGLQFILVMGLCALTIFICATVRSTAFGVIATLLIVMEAIAGGIMGIVYKLFGTGSVIYKALGKCMISLLGRQLRPEVSGNDVWNVIIVGICGIIVYTVISSIIMTKRDVV